MIEVVWCLPCLPFVIKQAQRRKWGAMAKEQSGDVEIEVGDNEGGSEDSGRFPSRRLDELLYEMGMRVAD